MKKLTPNLIVDDIEACLPFWVERLGFKKLVEVPHGKKLGFVILKRGGVQVMLQSTASMKKDMKVFAKSPYRAMLYIDVPKLAPIKKALDGWPIAMPERKTFYGALEIGVHDPAGNAVIFAEH